MNLKNLKKNSLIRIFEGKYAYHKGEKLYADEVFEIYENFDNKNVVYASEFVSRLSSGQFLKTSTIYEVSEGHQPINVIVERSVGGKEVSEFFEFHHRDGELIYRFESRSQTEKVVMPLSKKINVITPNITSKCIFTLIRKYEATSRAPYSIMKSLNTWEFTGLPKEDIIFATFDTQNMQKKTIGNATFNTFDVNIYENDDWTSSQEEKPVVLHVTQEYAIPLEVALTDGSTIKLLNLRRHETPEKMLNY